MTVAGTPSARASCAQSASASRTIRHTRDPTVHAEADEFGVGGSDGHRDDAHLGGGWPVFSPQEGVDEGEVEQDGDEVAAERQSRGSGVWPGIGRILAKSAGRGRRTALFDRGCLGDDQVFGRRGAWPRYGQL